ncbi:MAG: spore germination protein, partial [Oscillospiraceae bacterium]|nr:spore germination protein [Oscillospiraceae bacterium]
MNDFANESLSPDIGQNIRRIREISDNGSDVMVNEFLLSGVPAALLTCEGMVSTSMITELILEPITRV